MKDLRSECMNHIRSVWKLHHNELIQEYNVVFDQVRTLKHRIFVTLKKYFTFQSVESDYTGWTESPAYKKYCSAEKFGFTHKDYTSCESACLYAVVIKIGRESFIGRESLTNPMMNPISLTELKQKLSVIYAQRVHTLAKLNKIWAHFTQQAMKEWFEVAIRIQHMLSQYLLHYDSTMIEEKGEFLSGCDENNSAQNFDPKESKCQQSTSFISHSESSHSELSHFNQALIKRLSKQYRKIKDNKFETWRTKQELGKYRRHLEIVKLFTGKLNPDLLKAVDCLCSQFQQSLKSLKYEKLYSSFKDCLLQTCLNQIQHDVSKLEFAVEDGSHIIRISKVIEILTNGKHPTLEQKLEAGTIVRRFIHENKIEFFQNEKVTITENDQTFDIYAYRRQHLPYLLEALLLWVAEWQESTPLINKQF